MTPLERRFVKYMAATGDREYAAWKAGYASPATEGSRQMKNAVIRESVAEAQFRRVQDELSVKAFDTYDEVLSDKKLPVHYRLKAADKVSDVMLKLRGENGPAKELSEMTMAELQALGREAEQNARMAHHLLEVMTGQVEDAEAVEIQPEGDVFG